MQYLENEKHLSFTGAYIPPPNYPKPKNLKKAESFEPNIPNITQI